MTELGRATSSHAIALPDAGGATLTLSWGAATDVGRRRDHNEDSYVVDAPYFVVADGMGGHLAGDRASDAVVRRLADSTREPFASRQTIQRALLLATADIERAAGGNAIGAGTTVTGVALVAGQGQPAALVFNVGDSRTYRSEAGGPLKRLTIDHSVVQEMVDAGVLRAEDAESHPDSNVITRAVGFGEPRSRTGGRSRCARGTATSCAPTASPRRSATSASRGSPPRWTTRRSWQNGWSAMRSSPAAGTT